MKIAVTAASGQLGSAIISQLVSRIGERHVIGIARTPANAKDLGIQIMQGDYNDFEAFENAFHGVDVVLLISGMDAPDKRIGQHQNVIHAAQRAGVRKIVYTSIFGHEQPSAFNAIIASNRQTEKDIQASGMEWVIGRNGLYIEADLEYISTYIEEGKIVNCAGSGRCGYTSRRELARAYAEMILNDKLNGGIYTLSGTAITQQDLADAINRAFSTKLPYVSVAPEVYLKQRQAALGEFMGMVIAGIYTGIQSGSFEVPSDYAKVMGREHFTLDEMIQEFRGEI